MVLGECQFWTLRAGHFESREFGNSGDRGSRVLEVQGLGVVVVDALADSGACCFSLMHKSEQTHLKPRTQTKGHPLRRGALGGGNHGGEPTEGNTFIPPPTGTQTEVRLKAWGWMFGGLWVWNCGG